MNLREQWSERRRATQERNARELEAGRAWAAQHPARPATKDPNSGLVMAGWITFAIGLFFWPIFIAPFVIGIILAARGVAGHGAAMIVLSVLGPIVSIVVIAALLSGS